MSCGVIGASSVVEDSGRHTFRQCYAYISDTLHSRCSTIFRGACPRPQQRICSGDGQCRAHVGQNLPRQGQGVWSRDVHSECGWHPLDAECGCTGHLGGRVTWWTAGLLLGCRDFCLAQQAPVGLVLGWLAACCPRASLIVLNAPGHTHLTSSCRRCRCAPQPHIVAAIAGVALKSMVECIRLQALGRAGLQQLQLDCHYLRALLCSRTGTGASSTQVRLPRSVTTRR
eukprot:56357-Chlamydomonas_euryale.AAC.11